MNDKMNGAIVGMDFTREALIDLAHKAAEQLQGTCKSLIELGEVYEHVLDNDIFCQELDQLVFECNECGWWCEISEMSDTDQVCDECKPEDD